MIKLTPFLVGLFFLSSCATKYIVPSNRFLTPESQGGVLGGQAEIQQSTGHLLSVDTSQGSVDEGVLYSDSSRTGFLISQSLFEPLDFYWSHIGSGNSLLGIKYQFLGSSRSARGAGHKAAVSVAFGGNEHETDDESVEFELDGREFLFLYGYRLNPFVLPYGSLSYSKYDFEGKIHSRRSSLNGLRPEMETTVQALNGGVELSVGAFFAKLEYSYQRLETTDTKLKSASSFGYSLGLSW